MFFDSDFKGANDFLRFVTTRDEESMARSSDDVFLAEEESESFKQQVVVFLSYHSPILYD